MKQDRIKRALHSFIDRMDYKLQRKSIFLYFRIGRTAEQ